MDLAKSQKIVNKVLATFLDEQKIAAQSLHPSYGRLYEEIERVVFAGGKRLRPHLVFLGRGAYDEQTAKVAAAHELLHTALLIHDDIIDRDTMRHGQATIHHTYNSSHYTPFIDDEQERRHFSTSAALLAGDILITAAHELIRQANLPQAQYQEVARIMNTGTFEVVGGELLDTEASFVPNLFSPLLVYRYKTASYSFIAPLLTGAALTNHSKTGDDTTLRDYATHLGIAYQIKDDVLGVFGDSNATGKSNTGDLREGKQTMLISEFIKNASHDQLKLFHESFGKPDASTSQLEALKEAIRQSGALKVVTKLENDYMQKALSAAHDIKDPSLQKSLLELVDLLNGRAA